MFIECKTYRNKGHSKNDKRVYRTREEEAEWIKKDPIARFKKKILQNNLLTEDKAEEIELKIKKEIEAAAEFALNSPPVLPDSLYDNLYE